MGTVIVTVALVTIVTAVVKKMVKDKKKGISHVCGCNCKNCGGHCHS